MQTTLTEPTPDILDKHGAAKYLKIGVRTLDAYMHRGMIPYFRLGKTIRFKRTDLEMALEKFRVA